MATSFILLTLDFSLIKTIEFLYHFIDRHRNISSAPSRQVHSSAHDTQAEFPVNMDIFISQIFPQILFLFQILLRAGAYQHNRGNRGDNVQVSEEILPQMLVTDPLSRNRIDHETVHQKLLVNSAYHHVLMH